MGVLEVRLGLRRVRRRGRRCGTLYTERRLDLRGATESRQRGAHGLATRELASVLTSGAPPNALAPFPANVLNAPNAGLISTPPAPSGLARQVG